MGQLHIIADTLDDLMRYVFKQIKDHGERIEPSRGPATEITGVLLELTAPRARLSRTDTRGKPFSCLGELCWYLAGTNKVEFISYYIPQYRREADEGRVFGGYGPRLFNWKNIDQLSNVLALLRRNPGSRKAVIQLFDSTDIVEDHKDVPCTCTLQFLVRKDQLHALTCMRSNDAYFGLPHDIFCFTMLQELVARSLSVELGTYKHFVGSLHLYKPTTDLARSFLDEGWQSTQLPMPPMPLGDPWAAVDSMLIAESKIRTGQSVDDELASLDPYWADLVRLLWVFRCKKNQLFDDIGPLRDAMSSEIYEPFITKLMRR